MYRVNTRIARQVGRRTGHTSVPFRGPHMHRGRIRTTIGATASVIAIFRLFPWMCRSDESSAINLGMRHGFANSDAERKEGSP